MDLISIRQKYILHKKNNPQGIYWQQSFIEKIDKDINNVNKIYSFSVMQYCAPENLKSFFEMQLEFALRQKSKRIIIFHGDVPDKNLAVFYYKNFKHSVVEKYKNNLRLIFNDGSYWHDMDNVKYIVSEICNKFSFKYNLYISPIENHYRSNIVLNILK